MSTNQSQVLRGGIVACLGPCAAPDFWSVGGTRPTGVESLLRCVGGLIEFMGTSSGTPWLQSA
jgi:hypothetical protein